MKEERFYKVIEKEGVYKGFNYNIKIMRMGHRCGYVEIPDDITLTDQDFSYEADFEVHGGITYAKYENDKQVLGFDMAHYMDAPDLETAKKYFDYTVNDLMIQNMNSSMYEDCTIRSLSYVEQECQNLIDQIIKKYRK